MTGLAISPGNRFSGSGYHSRIESRNQRTNNLFKNGGAALPMQFEEKDLPFWRTIIMYNFED